MKKYEGQMYDVRRIFLVVTLVLTAAFTWADQTITGTVLDMSGEPLIGASVHVPSTSTGTITDIDGNFSLSVPDNVRQLEISYMGYKTMKADIRNGQIGVRMQEDITALQEVVAIGYGSVKKGDVTNAVAQIKAEDLEDRPVADIASALQGELAGVEVQSTSGQPGSAVSIKVRGATSINESMSSSPLFVVDGIPMDDDFGMQSLNPQDIQSIEVLKDASSSAIYGSRGANGVILITSKKAKNNDKLSVTFSTNLSLATPERYLNVMTPEEWIRFRSDANYQSYVNRYGQNGAQFGDSYAEQVAITGGAAASLVNDPRWAMAGYGGLNAVDWQKAIFKTAFAQNYNLSVMMGNKIGNMRASVGYTKQDGIVINTGFQRLNTRLQASAKLKDKFTVSLDVSPQYTVTNGGNVDGKDNAAMSAVTTVPFTENEAGLYTGAEPFGRYIYAGSTVSQVAVLNERTYKDENIRINSNLKLDYEILKGWHVEVLGSWTFNNRERHIFTPSSVNRSWSSGEGQETTSTWFGNRSHRWMLQALTNYEHTWLKKHHFKMVAGWSMESNRDGSSFEMAAREFPNNAIEGWTINDVTATKFTATYTTQDHMMSAFGRAEYGYDNRYLINVSLRADGYSRFGKNKKWGVFPAVSGAWRISEEHFWDESWKFNQLKLRASWGVNGSNRVSYGAAEGLLTPSYYSEDGTVVAGYIPSSSENADLSWQKTDSWDVGLDVGLFKNRISFAIDYYQKTIRDMLYQVTLPSAIGYAKGWSNIGNVKTQGVEIELKTENISRGKFHWTTKFTAAWSTNKVTDLGENSAIYTGYDNKTQIIEVGHAIGEYYLYIADGVYQTQEDLAKYPRQSTSGIGSVRYRDVNGDGQITEADRTYVGKPQPDWVFGMTNTFKYGDFDASIVFTGQTGGRIWSALGRAVDRFNMGVTNNALEHWSTGQWLSETRTGDGSVPAAQNGSGQEEYSTRWLYSTDFFKIKNITLGYRYRLPKKYMCQVIRFSLSCENVYMADRYSGGFSPESNNSNGVSVYDYGAYPQARSYAIGLKFEF